MITQLSIARLHNDIPKLPFTAETEFIKPQTEPKRYTLFSCFTAITQLVVQLLVNNCPDEHSYSTWQESYTFDSDIAADARVVNGS